MRAKRPGPAQLTLEENLMDPKTMLKNPTKAENVPVSNKSAQSTQDDEQSE